MLIIARWGIGRSVVVYIKQKVYHSPINQTFQERDKTNHFFYVEKLLFCQFNDPNWPPKLLFHNINMIITFNYNSECQYKKASNHYCNLQHKVHKQAIKLHRRLKLESSLFLTFHTKSITRLQGVLECKEPSTLFFYGQQYWANGNQPSKQVID